MTKEEAQKVIQDDKQERLAKCSDLFAQAQRECRCQLTAFPQITPEGKVIAVIQLVAQE